MQPPQFEFSGNDRGFGLQNEVKLAPIGATVGRGLRVKYLPSNPKSHAVATKNKKEVVKGHIYIRLKIPCFGANQLPGLSGTPQSAEEGVK